MGCTFGNHTASPGVTLQKGAPPDTGEGCQDAINTSGDDSAQPLIARTLLQESCTPVKAATREPSAESSGASAAKLAEERGEERGVEMMAEVLHQAVPPVALTPKPPAVVPRGIADLASPGTRDWGGSRQAPSQAEQAPRLEPAIMVPEPSGAGTDAADPSSLADAQPVAAGRTGVGTKRRTRGDGCCGDSCCDPCGSPSQVEVAGKRLEGLVEELFRLHDLNDDGVLEEAELIRLNETVAVVHQGQESFDAEAIADKYRTLFRNNFDADGRPVPYKVFRDYTFLLLQSHDSNAEAQEMIMEALITEARLARIMVKGSAPALPTCGDAAAGLPKQLASRLSCYGFCATREESTEMLIDANGLPSRS